MSDPEQPFIVVCDVYANGYDKDPTQRDVSALPIDPTNLPQVGDKIAVSTVNYQPYAINSGGGGTLPAKISNNASAPTAYQVDIYANGYLQPPTQTAVNAQIVDLDASNFDVGDQVAIFNAAGGTWIISSHPFKNITPKPRFCARLTTNYGGEDGVYGFAETVAPQGILKTGGITGACREAGVDSQQAWAGLDVWIDVAPDATFWFWFPLGT